MAGKTQIEGGAFQDFEGNVLAFGYLTMQLSHDEQESVNPGQVFAGYAVKVPLDANGNVAGAVFVWPNDQLNPANSFYVVNAYRADGTLAWLAPQYETVPSTSPFNIGTWVPNNPPAGGGGPIGSVLLQTNGVNNGDQAKLNLYSSDSSVTLTDDGSGDIDLQAGGGSSGDNVVSIPPFQGSAGNLSAHSIVLTIPAPMVQATGASMRVGLTFNNITSVVIDNASVGATLPNPISGIGGFTYNYAWTTAPVTITWPVGSFVNDNQIYFSNPVAITVDANHDYYIAVYLDGGNTANSPYSPTNSSAVAFTNLAGYITGDHTSDPDASQLVGRTQGTIGIQQVVIG